MARHPTLAPENRPSPPSTRRDSCAVQCASCASPESTTAPTAVAPDFWQTPRLSFASGSAPFRADQILIDCVGIIVGRSNRLDLDQALGCDSVEHGVEHA